MDATDQKASHGLSDEKESLLSNLEATPEIDTKERVSKDGREYDMGHSRRGKAVIFCHQTFDNDPDLFRKGADVDLENVKNTLIKLGFDVEAHENKVITEIDEILEKVRNEKHEDADCLLVMVMTHGENGSLMDSNYRPYDPYDRLWSIFESHRCPSLVGKPKIFFLQACQGELRQRGVSKGSNSRFYKRNSSPQKFSSYRLPSQADYVVMSSTIADHVSFRNKLGKGSYFVHHLCTVLNQCWDSQDLVSMLTEVSRCVATGNYGKNKEEKQIPCMTSLLTKKVYFGKGSKNVTKIGRLLGRKNTQ